MFGLNDRWPSGRRVQRSLSQMWLEGQEALTAHGGAPFTQHAPRSKALSLVRVRQCCSQICTTLRRLPAILRPFYALTLMVTIYPWLCGRENEQDSTLLGNMLSKPVPQCCLQSGLMRLLEGW